MAMPCSVFAFDSINLCYVPSNPLRSSHPIIFHTAMEHQDQYSEQKVLPVTDTRTVQSLIESTQDGSVDDNSQNDPADGPPAVEEQEDEDRNLAMQCAAHEDSDHVPSTPRQSSFHGPCQTITSSTSKITSGASTSPAASPTVTSNKDSFNSFTIQNLNLSFHGLGAIPEEHVHNRGTGINANQEELGHTPYYEMSQAGNDTTTPTTLATKVGLAVSRSLSTQIPTSDTPRKSVQASDPSPTTSTKHRVHKDYSASAPSLQTENDHCNTSISNTRMPQAGEQAVVHASSQSAGPLGETLHTMEPEVPLGHIENSDTSRRGVQAIRILNSTNRFKHSVKSIRTSIMSGVDRSVTSFATRSKSPSVSMTLRAVGKVPAVQRRPGMKKEFPPVIEVYMHAELDPSPGRIPFHPLWDPNITHKRSTDGSIPPVHGVNVYDIGYFDVSGDFILLFNLRMSKEENEEFLKFKFKTPFIPLTGITAAVGIEFNAMQKYKTFHQTKKIQLDLELSKYNTKSELHEYQYTFKVRKDISTGAAIAMMGPLIHFRDREIVFSHQDYFTTQCIEWYRHAKRQGKHHIENGDLVLITECYKAPSWGYIIYNGKTTAKETSAHFHYGDGGKGLYGWRYASLPGLRSACRQSKEGDPTAGLPDQCVGFRGYSIHCDPKAWKSMCRGLEAESPRIP